MTLLREQVRVLSAKSEQHTALAELSDQLSAAKHSEASLRNPAVRGDGRLSRAEQREAELRAAADAALAAAHDAHDDVARGEAPSAAAAPPRRGSPSD